MATEADRSATLLGTVLDRLGENGRSLVTLTRMCLVGKLSGTSNADIATFASWCDNFCRAPAEVTGLLLMVDGGFITTVEGPTNDLLPFLRALNSQLEPGGSLTTLKVVSQQEDVRGRYFPKWCHHKMSVVRSNYAELELEGAQTALLAETAISMLKIGKVLTKNGASTSALDKWESDSALADMPSNERVGQLLEMDEIVPLDKFMSIFEAPVDIMIDSERAWPPPHPQPY